MVVVDGKGLPLGVSLTSASPAEVTLVHSTLATIAAHLDDVLKREGVQAEVGVTAELARLARGSMRDALSLTDQLLARVGEEPAVDDVQRLAGQSSAGRIDLVSVSGN